MQENRFDGIITYLVYINYFSFIIKDDYPKTKNQTNNNTRCMLGKLELK